MLQDLEARQAKVQQRQRRLSATIKSAQTNSVKILLLVDVVRPVWLFAI